MSESAETDRTAMRYFIDSAEVSEAVALRAEACGAASVMQGGSGVVPEHLRQPGERPEQYLRPWLVMQRTSATQPGADK